MHALLARTDVWLLVALVGAVIDPPDDSAPPTLPALTAPAPATTQDQAPSAFQQLRDKSVGALVNSLNVPANPRANPQQAAPQPPAKDEAPLIPDDTRRLTLVQGQSTTIELAAAAKTIDHGNPAIVRVRGDVDTPTKLRVIAGEKPGIAEVLVIDEKGERHLLRVTVIPDTTHLQNVLQKVFPDTQLRVEAASDTAVVIGGFVENPELVLQIVEVATRLGYDVINAIQVVGVQQVTLRVVVAEVSRTKLRALGFDWFSADSDSFFIQRTGGLFTPTSIQAPGIQFKFSEQDTNIMFGFDHDSTWRGFLQALKQEGVAKVLAEPTLTAISGRTAKFLSGGEFPIIIPGQQNTFTVEFREFGIKLDFVPTVLGGGNIRLEVRPEISAINYNNGVVMQGFTVPGLDQRYAETAVTMRSGQTLAIPGLFNTNDTAKTKKVPWLGDMPYIGAAFRTVQYEREETELIILITPELAAPMSPAQVPCAVPGSESGPPTDHELFLHGKVEGPGSPSHAHGLRESPRSTEPAGRQPQAQTDRRPARPKSTASAGQVAGDRRSTPTTGSAVAQRKPAAGRNDAAVKLGPSDTRKRSIEKTAGRQPALFGPTGFDRDQ